MKRFCKLNKKVLTLSTRYYVFIRIQQDNKYKALSSSASASLKVVLVPRKLTLVVRTRIKEVFEDLAIFGFRAL